MQRITLTLLLLCLCQGLLAGAEAGKPGMDYLCWDAHRFSRTPEDHERDARFLKDLGFTHSLLQGSILSKNKNGEARAEKLEDALKVFAKYDLYAGLRLAWEFDEFAMPVEEQVASGVLLLKKAKEDHPTYNPMHPKVIEHYTEAFKRSIAEYVKYDPGRRLTWFLIGTERTWPLPKNEDEAHAKALELLFAAAREDGILQEGERDLTKLGAWWSGAHGQGRDWRLRKSVEDALLKLIPEAEFFVDPAWAVKIVHGFGGDWTYIENEPKHIADAVLRLKAVCRPAPVIHSTQLIRGSHRDCLMEANLLALCMGADKLYHWGVHTIEPGMEANPFYRQKIEKTAENEKTLRQDIVDKRRDKEPALRATGRLLRERGALFRQWQPLAPRVALLAGAYGAEVLNLSLITGHIPFDILKEQADRRAALKQYACAAVVKERATNEDLADLLEMEQAGKPVFLPAGFEYLEGQPKLTKALAWDPGFMLPKDEAAPAKPGKKKPKPALVGTPQEQRALLHQWAAEFRKQFHAAGFNPYFDSGNLDCVMGGFEHHDARLAFLVNDKRKSSEGATGSERIGVDNEVELFIRDQREGLRGLDVESGEELKLAKTDGGWKLSVLVPAAWYRLVAVLEPGKTWKGPGPLPAAPEIKALAVKREGPGVKLAWELPFADWVGCDVERYELQRAAGAAEFQTLTMLDGRIMQGPGGVSTSFKDETAKPGTAWAYRLRAISPLRTSGPWSAKAEVRP